MKKNNRFGMISKIVSSSVLVCIIAVSFLYFNHDIGIMEKNVVEDIRSSQSIEEEWITEGTTSEIMAAYISYPKDKSRHVFSIYLNHPGVSFGYFFFAGGSVFEIDEYVTEFTRESYNEKAFISMNKQKIERLEINNGDSIRVIEIDGDKPFAIVLPLNAGEIKFYDVNGDNVETVKHRL